MHFLLPFVLLAIGLVHMTVGHKSYTQHSFSIHTTEFDRASFGYTTLIKDVYSMWFFGVLIV